MRNFSGYGKKDKKMRKNLLKNIINRNDLINLGIGIFVGLFMNPHRAHLNSFSIFSYRVELQAGHFFGPKRHDSWWAFIII